MKITLSLDLDEEQTSAVEYHAKTISQEGVDPAIWLSEQIMSHINGWVDEAYNHALSKLGQDARPLPYETRLSLINQVRTELSGQSKPL